MLKKNWWKILAVLIMLYVLPAAWLGKVSTQVILNETIRNLYWHVTMWFAMMILLIVSMVYSIKLLSKNRLKDDVFASASAHIAMVFGVIGILTGMVWANFTWGKPWVNDPQLNGAAIVMLTYFAYFILRSGIEDPHKKARISAAYNLVAFVLMVVLLGIMPRINESLHPGKGGNPGFGAYDKGSLISAMRPVFYSAVIGYTLLGVWMMQILSRKNVIKLQKKHLID